MNQLMVKIPAGSIELRDNRIKQKWTVDLPAFLLSKYLVTQSLYLTVTQKSPSTFAGSQHPVETVSWKDAIIFCNQLSLLAKLAPCYTINAIEEDITFQPTANGYRLPTEAEWEFACKADTPGTRYGTLEEIAWYKENSAKSTQPVGLKQANSWGLYDMLGNVWEWCTDIYDAQVYGSYRIIRGGGWYDEARGCMATNRRRSHPFAYKIDDLGFRVAQNTPAVAR